MTGYSFFFTISINLNVSSAFQDAIVYYEVISLSV